MCLHCLRQFGKDTGQFTVKLFGPVLVVVGPVSHQRYQGGISAQARVVW